MGAGDNVRSYVASQLPLRFWDLYFLFPTPTAEQLPHARLRCLGDNIELRAYAPRLVVECVGVDYTAQRKYRMASAPPH